MTINLIWNITERISFIQKCLKQYIDGTFDEDEIHYILDFCISNTLKLQELEVEYMFNDSFFEYLYNFQQDYINKYTDIPLIELDIHSSNYILKNEFKEGLKKLYTDLSKI